MYREGRTPFFTFVQHCFVSKLDNQHAQMMKLVAEGDELATRAWYYAQLAPPPPPAEQQAKHSKKQPQPKNQPNPPRGGQVMSSESSATLFDFDCNLTHADLRAGVAQLLASAASVGVHEMLVPGATLAESRAAIELCASRPAQLFPTAGVHPYNAHAAPSDEEMEQLKEMLEMQEVRAAGECGLDYSPGFPAADTQRQWFKAQLELACILDKPLFLHERLAFEDFSAMIADAKAQTGTFPPAVVHCFTGNARELDAYVAQDFYIGVTGFLCKQTHGAELREIIKRVPLDRLVVETDAPYMGFPGCRALEQGDARKNKKQQYPNVPSALPRVVAAVAEALGQTPQRIAEVTRANARRFLRL